MTIFGVAVPAEVLWAIGIGAAIGFVVAFFMNVFVNAFGGPGAMTRRELWLLYAGLMLIGAFLLGVVVWGLTASWVQALLAVAAGVLLWMICVAVGMNRRRA